MKYQKEKYSNPTEALVDIDKSFHNLQGQFISLGHEYANKISGSIVNDVFYLFRDNIIRRISAALYHYDILAHINISGNPRSFDFSQSPPDGFYIALHQSYVFDSVIFHLVSGFDYCASFIKYLTYGHKDNRSEVWSKLAKGLSAKGKLAESQLGHEIKIIDAEFVKKLCDYRAKLIHNESDFPGFSQKTARDKGESIITVISPQAFHNKFKKQLPPRDECSMNEIALWMLDSSIEAVSRLLKTTSVYFSENRKIPVGKEVILFDQPLKK